MERRLEENHEGTEHIFPISRAFVFWFPHERLRCADQFPNDRKPARRFHSNLLSGGIAQE